MERHTRVLSLNGVQNRTHETKETTKRGIARRRTCVQEAGFGDFWQMNIRLLNTQEERVTGGDGEEKCIPMESLTSMIVTAP